MAKQDEWTRLTVRLPPDLYARLSETVATGPNSMNAEIVARLEASFEQPSSTSTEDTQEYVTKEDLVAAVEAATRDGIYTAFAKISRAAGHQTSEAGRELAKERIFLIFEEANKKLKDLDEKRGYEADYGSARARELLGDTDPDPDEESSTSGASSGAAKKGRALDL